MESHGVISNIETVQTCVFWGLSNLSDCSRRLYGISAADLHLKTSCVVLMLKPVGVNLTGLFGHSKSKVQGPEIKTMQSILVAPLPVRLICTAGSDSLCDITEGPAAGPYRLHSALEMQNDRHEDLGIFFCMLLSDTWFNSCKIQPNKESS